MFPIHPVYKAKVTGVIFPPWVRITMVWSWWCFWVEESCGEGGGEGRWMVESPSAFWEILQKSLQLKQPVLPTLQWGKSLLAVLKVARWRHRLICIPGSKNPIHFLHSHSGLLSWTYSKRLLALISSPSKGDLYDLIQGTVHDTSLHGINLVLRKT